MAAKQTKKSNLFYVVRRYTVEIAVPIQAENFTDALTQAKALQQEQFLEVIGELHDYTDHGITSVFSSYGTAYKE